MITSLAAGGVNVIELVSSLPPDECAARLRMVIDCNVLTSWFGSKPVVGRVQGRSVRLRKRICYGNAFQTFLTGRLEAHGEGTIFRGTAEMHPLVTGFLVVWFAGVVLGVGIVFVSTIAGSLRGGVQAAAVILPLMMLAFGVGLVWFGRYLARNEEQFLVAFMADVLGAREEADAEQRLSVSTGRTTDGN